MWTFPLLHKTPPPPISGGLMYFHLVQPLAGLSLGVGFSLSLCLYLCISLTHFYLAQTQSLPVLLPISCRLYLVVSWLYLDCIMATNNDSCFNYFLHFYKTIKISHLMHFIIHKFTKKQFQYFSCPEHLYT